MKNTYNSSQLSILSLISEKDRYGYEIIKELSDPIFEGKEGSLYPILHHLQSRGYLKTYTLKLESGKSRKYYRITKKGSKQLIEDKKTWKLFSTSVLKVVGDMRASAFEG